ncbi:MAG TPA: hypothetical protein VH740_12870 [Vicinamibacterales bacterium]
MSRRLLFLPVSAALAAVTLSCAPRLVALPTGGGAAFPEYASAYAEAIDRCRGIRTLRGVLAISGRAAGNRMRASIDAGFEAPSSVRLELPAPGRPIFVFVASNDRATLLLPRDRRVLRDAPPAATLEALAGIALSAEDLRSIVSGCGFGAAQPTSGRAFDRGWASIAAGETTNYLRTVEGRWRLVASSRGPIEVRYDDFAAGAPTSVRLRAMGPQPTDLIVRLSQVDTNETLGPEVFRIDIPSDASPLTLDELRQAGPLGR